LLYNKDSSTFKLGVLLYLTMVNNVEFALFIYNINQTKRTVI